MNMHLDGGLISMRNEMYQMKGWKKSVITNRPYLGPLTYVIMVSLSIILEVPSTVSVALI